MFLFWFYTRTDQSDPCMSVCSCSGSIPEQTSQTPVCLCLPVVVLYKDRPIRPLYVCMFQFWFYTRTDQSDPCMSVYSCSRSMPGQTSQTPVCLSVRFLVLNQDRPVPFLVLYQDRRVRPLQVCTSCSGSISGQTSQTPVCLYVPVLVLYPDRPVSLLYVCEFLFWFYTRTHQSDPSMTVCSCSVSIPGQTSQSPVCLCVPVLDIHQDSPVTLMYVCVFLFWFYTRTDQSDPCVTVCSCSGSIPGETSQTPVCLCVPVLVLYQARPLRPLYVCVSVLVLYKDRPVRPLYVCVLLFFFYICTDQSDPCISLCSCSDSLSGQTLYVCVFLFWFCTRTDQSDPCMSVCCSCSCSIPGQTSQTPVCLCVPVLVLYQDRLVRPQ